MSNNPRKEIIEKEAKDLAERMFYGRGRNTMEGLKSSVYNGTSNFTRTRDKVDFLTALDKEIKAKQEAHICNSPGNCVQEEWWNKGRFIIESEIEDYMGSIEEPSVEPEDRFTGSEWVEINEKMDDMIEILRRSEAASEVLFNELEELKERMSFGKKNFRQLLAGKLVDMVGSGVVDRTVGNAIYNGLVDAGKTTTRFLENLA